MSLEKVRSAKSISIRDKYSQNNVVNSLIKNKLHLEIKDIKQSVAHIITKQDISPLPLKRKPFSIHPQTIRDSVNYDPIIKAGIEIEELVAKKQNESYLIPIEELGQINEARLSGSGVSVKLSKADCLKFVVHQDLKGFANKTQKKMICDYGNKAWLPSQPETANLISVKTQMIQEQSINKEEKRKQLTNFYHRLTNTKTHSKSFSEFLLPPLKPTNQINPVQYAPHKYHKLDYKLVDTWLDNTLQKLSTQPEKTVAEKLNIVYSSYMCVWKEIIRLTYIESAQKGVIVEKSFFSMLRLFWGLIGEQRSICKVFESENRTSNQEVNELLKKRMDELNNRYIFQCEQIESNKKSLHRLSQVIASYDKINKELVEEIQKLSKQNKQRSQELTSITTKFYKSLTILHQKQQIQMETNQNIQQFSHSHKSVIYRTFITLDEDLKPVILGQFKQNDRYLHLSKTAKQSVSQQLAKYNSRYGANIKQIENQMVRYWAAKENDIELREVMDGIWGKYIVKDCCVGTPTMIFQQYGMQFPEEDQKLMEKLLAEQKRELEHKFQKQKDVLKHQINHQQSLLTKWKQTYQDLQQKNKSLNELSQRLAEDLKRAKSNTKEVIKQFENLMKQKAEDQKLIQNLRIEIQNRKTEQKQMEEANSALHQLTKKAEKQKQNQFENNKHLIRLNLEMQSKVKSSEQSYNNLVKSVKNVAPWLQKFMTEIDKPMQQINLNLFTNVSQKIEEYLCDYVVKDSALFMTRLT